MGKLSDELSGKLGLTSGKPVFKGISDYKIFPFHTREPERAKFTNGFDPILGVLARGSLGYKLHYSENDYNLLPLVDSFDIDEEMLGEENKEQLIRNIFNYDHLDSLKLPYLLNYKTLTNNRENIGEQDIGLFLIELFQLDQNEEWKKFIGDKRPSNLIEKIIIELLKEPPPFVRKRKYKIIVKNLFPQLNNDLNYLLKHKDFALNNLSLFFAFYYFQYILQNALYSDKINKTNIGILEKLYFTLESENITGTRETIKNGYNHIKEVRNNLLVNERLIGYINQLIDDQKFYDITEIINFSGDIGSNFDQELNDFLYQYKEFINKDEIIPFMREDKIKLFKKWLKDDLSKETISRYFKSIEEIGNHYFIKNRGQLGKVLTLKNNTLILLTALCIKEDKMIIKDLFFEFEKRGVYLDRYSKEKIVELYDQMNILDKKSDSGEAIYVKSIL